MANDDAEPPLIKPQESRAVRPVLRTIGPVIPSRLMPVIRFLAGHSERVIFSDHAIERMDERGVTDEEVLSVLRLGEIRGAVAPGDGCGEWRCKVVARPRGSRLLGVVTIVMLDDYLFIKTVEWEDK